MQLTQFLTYVQPFEFLDHQVRIVSIFQISPVFPELSIAKKAPSLPKSQYHPKSNTYPQFSISKSKSNTHTYPQFSISKSKSNTHNQTFIQHPFSSLIRQVFDKCPLRVFSPSFPFYLLYSLVVSILSCVVGMASLGSVSRRLTGGRNGRSSRFHRRRNLVGTQEMVNVVQSAPNLVTFGVVSEDLGIVIPRDDVGNGVEDIFVEADHPSGVELVVNEPNHDIIVDSSVAPLSDEMLSFGSHVQNYLFDIANPYVMIVLKGSVAIALGGTEDPAAYGELVSIGGLSPNVNKQLSAAIAAILESKLSVPKSRFFLKFYDTKGSNFGWNGSTF